MSTRLGERGDNPVKAPVGGLDGCGQLADFPVVFDQTHFADDASQGVVPGLVVAVAEGIDHLGQSAVGISYEGRVREQRHLIGPVRAVSGLKTKPRCHIGKARASPGPEFSDGGVRIKLIARARRWWPGEENPVVASVLWDTEQDATWHRVCTPAREIDKGGVRAIGVIRVVGAGFRLTGGNHQGEPGKLSRESFPSRGREGSLGEGLD